MGLTTKKDQRSICIIFITGFLLGIRPICRSQRTQPARFLSHIAVHIVRTHLSYHPTQALYISVTVHTSQTLILFQFIISVEGPLLSYIHTNILLSYPYADSSLPTGGGGSRAQTQDLNDHVQRTRTSKREPHL